MLLLPIGILPSVRSAVGLFRYSLLPYVAIAPFSTTLFHHEQSGTHEPDAPSSTPKPSRYRYRYNNDPEFRKAQVLRARNYWNTPQGQERLRKIHERNASVSNARLRIKYQESSANRRAIALHGYVTREARLGRLETNLSWKTHTPLIFSSRVEHYCTPCDKDRLLKVWWEQKQSFSSDDETRYMCTRCFASDIERMMPEKHPAKLPACFTDTVDKRSNL